MSFLSELLGGNDAEWMTDPNRNCASGDPERFFPSESIADVWARKVCEGCPVSVPCLAYALEHPELLGVWGGTTEPERKRLRKGDAA